MARTFAWQVLPGVDRITVAYKQWQQAEARARLGYRRTAVLAAISAALGAAGTGLLVGTVLEHSAADEARQRTIELSEQEQPDSPALSQAMADYQAAATRRDAFGAFSVISFAATGLGVSFTLVSGSKAKRQVQAVGPWTPEALE